MSYFEDNIVPQLVARGIWVLPSEYQNSSSKVNFECPECHTATFMIWRDMQRCIREGRLPLCAMCRSNRRKAPKVNNFEKLKRILPVGVQILEETPKELKRQDMVYFTCSKCGGRASAKLDNLLCGSNKLFVCSDCRQGKRITEDTIRSLFSGERANLLSFDEPVSLYSSFTFSCEDCGTSVTTNMATFKNGRSLKCRRCKGQQPISKEEVAEYLELHNSHLLSEVVNAHTPFEFVCTQCGTPHKISWTSVRQGVNPKLLCEACLRGRKSSPMNLYGGGSGRRNIVRFWFRWINEFYNVESFPAHHIKKRSIYPELETSLTNGFPLPASVHGGPYSEVHQNLLYEDPANWPVEWALPYQMTPLVDLARFLVTETFGVDPRLENKGFLMQVKQQYANDGVQFIPFYWEEFATKCKRDLIYSMVRARIWPQFPDIYQYTGIVLHRFSARALVLEEVSSSEVRDFYEVSHIQGAIPASVNIVLKSGEEIISAMSFGKPRFQKDLEWELLRFAVLPNTMVLGGATRLFRNFIQKYNPQQVLAYCDCRFAANSPEDTVYKRLGFSFEGRTAPGFKYAHPDQNRLFSRQSLQKHKLKKILPGFDSTQTAEAQLRKEGYIRQYDCGNFKFLWEARE